MTPKLSRELSALQLSPTLISRRGRTRSASESQSSNSDTENEAPVTNKKDSNIEMPEETVAILNQNNSKMLKNPHFLRSKEAKVKKAASISLPLNFEAAAGASPTTVMSLRPRPQITSSVSASHTNTGNRKRKSELLTNNCSTTPNKSPRIVNMTKPVMTRSRAARVLQLKK